MRTLRALRLGLGWALFAMAATPALGTEIVTGAAPASAIYLPRAAEMSMLGALGAAREGLDLLAEASSPQDRSIAYATAIDGLTALYQLHGLAWAKDKLDWLYAQPDCPALLTGYSADGRLYLRLQTLELRNPAFANYTVVLCQLGSHSAESFSLSQDQPRSLTLELTDGALLTAEEITPAHPLWPHLARQAEHCGILREVPSGFTPSCKQVFAVPGLSINQLAAVLLEWGSYSIEIDHRLAEAREPAAHAPSGN
jgi:hypothetical protein